VVEVSAAQEAKGDDTITGVGKTVEYGVMATPEVVVDGSVKSEGRIPTREEIEKWLR